MSRTASALDFLCRRRSLTARQGLAAQRLASSYKLGVVGHRFTRTGPGALPTAYMDARVSALQDYERARDALGARLWPVVWAVACGDQSVQEFADERRISPAAAMTTLRLALDLLGDHWKLNDQD